MDLFKSIGKAMSFTNDDEKQMPEGSKDAGAANSTGGGGEKPEKKKKSLTSKLLSSNPFSALNPFDNGESSKGKKEAGTSKKLSPKRTDSAGKTRKAGAVVAGVPLGANPLQMALPPMQPLGAVASKARVAGRASASEVPLESSPSLRRFETNEDDAADAAAVDRSGRGTGMAVSTPRTGSFGSRPTQSLREMAAASAASGKSQGAQNAWEASSTASGRGDTPVSAVGGISSLQGTCRVKHHATVISQGNTIHFLVIAVQRSDISAAPSGGDAVSAPSRFLALIGLLEPLGSLRASTKAMTSRCELIRKLERVRIYPREMEVALLAPSLSSTAVSTSSSGTSAMSHTSGPTATDAVLVDPQNAAFLGVLLPYLRPIHAVSAVDGNRTEYWVACDGSGLHKAPLFDIEGPIDELNCAAVLRLRTHEMRREDLQLAHVTTEVSTQTLEEAKTLLQQDFERELEVLKIAHKKELERAKQECHDLGLQLEWRKREANEAKISSEAKEVALQSEIKELQRQLQLKISATQTSNVQSAAATPKVSRTASNASSVVAGASKGVHMTAQSSTTAGAAASRDQPSLVGIPEVRAPSPLPAVVSSERNASNTNLHMLESSALVGQSPHAAERTPPYSSALQNTSSTAHRLHTSVRLADGSSSHPSNGSPQPQHVDSNDAHNRAATALSGYQALTAEALESSAGYRHYHPQVRQMSTSHGREAPEHVSAYIAEMTSSQQVTSRPSAAGNKAVSGSDDVLARVRQKIAEGEQLLKLHQHQQPTGAQQSSYAAQPSAERSPFSEGMGLRAASGPRRVGASSAATNLLRFS